MVICRRSRVFTTHAVSTSLLRWSENKTVSVWIDAHLLARQCRLPSHSLVRKSRDMGVKIGRCEIGTTRKCTTVCIDREEATLWIAGIRQTRMKFTVNFRTRSHSDSRLLTQRVMWTSKVSFHGRLCFLKPDRKPMRRLKTTSTSPSSHLRPMWPRNWTKANGLCSWTET